MGLRHIFAVSVAASILLAAPGSAAFGATSPGQELGRPVTALDDPPDVEVPSDPEEPPPPREASIDEKEKAGLLANIPASSFEQYQKGDYLFTIELWRRAVFDTEVRAEAELALATYELETQRCDACTTFIRTTIYAAHQRDANQETTSRAQAFEARYRRQSVAAMVDYTFPNDTAIGTTSDRNFIFAIWEHLRAEKPWARRTIAAASTAVTASLDEQVDFLTTVGALHFYPDQTDRLAEDSKGDAEQLAEGERRKNRKNAGIAVGISFGQPGNEDESWYLINDSAFLDRLYTKIQGEDFYTLSANAMAIVLYDEGPAEWRAFINKGIYDVAKKDEERRAAERYEQHRKLVTGIRDEAVKLAYKNRAVAANAALATRKLGALLEFERTYPTLPADASDMAVLYDNGTAASAMWVFGQVGRKTGTARRVWTAPAGWRAVNAQPVNGEFDGKAGQDTAVLYKVANLSYRLEVFARTDAPSAPRTAWELKPATANTGYTLQAPVATDANGDGRTDVVSYGTDPAKKPILMTLYAEADGTFRQEVMSVPAALVAGRLVAGDVNGDGKGDLVTFVQHGTKGAQMWLALALAGDAGFAPAVERWSNTGTKLAETGTPVIGDFDQDNRPEIVMFRKETKTAALWMHDNIATGTVSFAKKWTSPNGWAFDALFPVATDVNGDARTDLAVMQRNDVTKASVWSIRAKSGGFEPAAQAWNSAKGTWRTANTKIAR